MTKNAESGSFGGYKMPTEKDIANTNIQKEVSNTNSTKSSISESYVIKNNTVK